MSEPGRAGPRRIAIVTQGYFIGGGVPAVTKWLATGLRESDRFEVDVIDLATSAGDVNSRRVVRPGSWFRRSLRGEGRDGIEQWGANAVEFEPMRYRARKELSRFLAGYDLIQVVGGSPAVARCALKSLRPVAIQAATTVKWERESQLAAQTGLKSYWRSFMTALVSHSERLAIKGADAVFVENEEMFQHVKSVGQTSVLKAPPGVDTELYFPAPGGWAKQGYFLSVCRLGDPRKGLDRTVRAYHLMREARSDLPKLVLAGRGQLRPDVNELIDELGLRPHVDVRSDVPFVELQALFHGASVFLQTSHEEGLGISVLEAMASGLALVATETAGSRETVDDGVTGWLVPQSDESVLPALFAAKVLDLFEENGEAFSRNGRTRAEEHFSLMITLEKFMSVYDQLLDGKHPTYRSHRLAEER